MTSAARIAFREPEGGVSTVPITELSRGRLASILEAIPETPTASARSVRTRVASAPSRGRLASILEAIPETPTASARSVRTRVASAPEKASGNAGEFEDITESETTFTSSECKLSLPLACARREPATSGVANKLRCTSSPPKSLARNRAPDCRIVKSAAVKS